MILHQLFQTDGLESLFSFILLLLCARTVSSLNQLLEGLYVQSSQEC